MFHSHNITSRDHTRLPLRFWTSLTGLSSLLLLTAACGQSSTTATQGPPGTATASLPAATSTPTLVPTETPTPSLSLIVKPTAITQTCDSALDPLPAQTITLDNSANNVALNWDALMWKPDFGGTWEISNPNYGTVPAHAAATFIVTPAANLCKEIQQAGRTGDVPLRLDVEVTSGNGSGTTVIDTVHAYSP